MSVWVPKGFEEMGGVVPQSRSPSHKAKLADAYAVLGLSASPGSATTGSSPRNLHSPAVASSPGSPRRSRPHSTTSHLGQFSPGRKTGGMMAQVNVFSCRPRDFDNQPSDSEFAKIQKKGEWSRRQYPVEVKPEWKPKEKEHQGKGTSLGGAIAEHDRILATRGAPNWKRKEGTELLLEQQGTKLCHDILETDIDIPQRAMAPRPDDLALVGGWERVNMKKTKDGALGVVQRFDEEVEGLHVSAPRIEPRKWKKMMNEATAEHILEALGVLDESSEEEESSGITSPKARRPEGAMPAMKHERFHSSLEEMETLLQLMHDEHDTKKVRKVVKLTDTGEEVSDYSDVDDIQEEYERYQAAEERVAELKREAKKNAEKKATSSSGWKKLGFLIKSQAAFTAVKRKKVVVQGASAGAHHNARDPHRRRRRSEYEHFLTSLQKTRQKSTVSGVFSKGRSSSGDSLDSLDATATSAALSKMQFRGENDSFSNTQDSDEMPLRPRRESIDRSSFQSRTPGREDLVLRESGGSSVSPDPSLPFNLDGLQKHGNYTMLATIPVEPKKKEESPASSVEIEAETALCNQYTTAADALLNVASVMVFVRNNSTKKAAVLVDLTKADNARITLIKAIVPARNFILAEVNPGERVGVALLGKFEKNNPSKRILNARSVEDPELASLKTAASTYSERGTSESKHSRRPPRKGDGGNPLIMTKKEKDQKMSKTPDKRLDSDLNSKLLALSGHHQRPRSDSLGSSSSQAETAVPIGSFSLVGDERDLMTDDLSTTPEPGGGAKGKPRATRKNPFAGAKLDAAGGKGKAGKVRKSSVSVTEFNPGLQNEESPGRYLGDNINTSFSASMSSPMSPLSAREAESKRRSAELLLKRKEEIEVRNKLEASMREMFSRDPELLEQYPELAEGLTRGEDRAYSSMSINPSAGGGEGAEEQSPARSKKGSARSKLMKATSVGKFGKSSSSTSLTPRGGDAEPPADEIVYVDLTVTTTSGETTALVETPNAKSAKTPSRKHNLAAVSKALKSAKSSANVLRKTSVKIPSPEKKAKSPPPSPPTGTGRGWDASVRSDGDAAGSLHAEEQEHQKSKEGEKKPQEVDDEEEDQKKLSKATTPVAEKKAVPPNTKKDVETVKRATPPTKQPQTYTPAEVLLQQEPSFLDDDDIGDPPHPPLDSGHDDLKPMPSMGPTLMPHDGKNSSRRVSGASSLGTGDDSLVSSQGDWGVRMDPQDDFEEQNLDDEVEKMLVEQSAKAFKRKSLFNKMQRAANTATGKKIGAGNNDLSNGTTSPLEASGEMTDLTERDAQAHGDRMRKAVIEKMAQREGGSSPHPSSSTMDLASEFADGDEGEDQSMMRGNPPTRRQFDGRRQVADGIRGVPVIDPTGDERANRFATNVKKPVGQRSKTEVRKVEYTRHKMAIKEPKTSAGKKHDPTPTRALNLEQSEMLDRLLGRLEAQFEADEPDEPVRPITSLGQISTATKFPHPAGGGRRSPNTLGLAKKLQQQQQKEAEAKKQALLDQSKSEFEANPEDYLAAAQGLFEQTMDALTDAARVLAQDTTMADDPSGSLGTEVEGMSPEQIQEAQELLMIQRELTERLQPLLDELRSRDKGEPAVRQAVLLEMWGVQKEREINIVKLVNILDRRVERRHGWLQSYRNVCVFADADPLQPFAPSKRVGSGDTRYPVGQLNVANLAPRAPLRGLLGAEQTDEERSRAQQTLRIGSAGPVAPGAGSQGTILGARQRHRALHFRKK